MKDYWLLLIDHFTRWSHATLVSSLLILGMSTAADSLAITLSIESKISSDKLNFFREKVPILNDVSIESVRYLELDGIVVLLRIEDERYCVVGHCVNIIANASATSFVSVFAANRVHIAPGEIPLGRDGVGPRGTLAELYVYVPKPGIVDAPNHGTDLMPDKVIRVFISERLVTVVP